MDCVALLGGFDAVTIAVVVSLYGNQVLLLTGVLAFFLSGLAVSSLILHKSDHLHIAG